MADIRRITVTVSQGQLAAIEAGVESGEYTTTSEIVREALQDWQHKRARRQEEIERLRRLWDDGKASGDGAPVDFDDLRKEARARLKAAVGHAA